MIASLIVMVACGLLAGQFRHVLGVAPILGATLGASCFCRPRDLWVVALGGLVVRDLVAGVFGPFTVVRLVAMALVVLTVRLLRVRLPRLPAGHSWMKATRLALQSVLAGLLVVVPVFHLALVVGDWATGFCAGYPRTPSGLWQTLVSAAPYAQRAFVGEVLFTTLFFGLAGAATAVLQRRRVVATTPSA